MCRIKQTLNNELKFLYLIIVINVIRCDESSLYVPDLTMSTALTGNFSAGVSRNRQNDAQGLARTRIALCQRPGAVTEETGRYDLSVERFACSVLKMLSVNSNELSKV